MNGLKPLDIVLAGVRVGHSTDPRPCVVLEVIRGVGAVVAPCSGQLDLDDEGLHFLIPRHHPDFHATGLARDTYVLEDDPTLLNLTRVRKRYGALTGELARDFREWYGID